MSSDSRSPPPARFALAGVFVDRPDGPAPVDVALVPLEDSPGEPWSAVVRDGKPVAQGLLQRLLLTEHDLALGISPEQALAQLGSYLRRGEVYACAVPEAWQARLCASGGAENFFDISSLAWLARPGPSPPSVDKLCAALGLEGVTLPRAEQLAQALARCLPRLVEFLSALPRALRAELARCAEQLPWVRSSLFAPCLADALKPPVPSLRRALAARERPRRPKRPCACPCGPDAVAAVLEPGGEISHAHPQYEHRPDQVAMARAVARALQEDQVCLIEAGTGVGKSLAYLVPAVLFCAATGERAAVSTATKVLQDQLIKQDIPLLRRALEVEFTAAVVKGRENYLCQRKLLELLREARETGEGDMLPLLVLLCWMVRSEEQDLEELGDAESLAASALGRVVRRVRSSSAHCLGRVCPQFATCAMERLRQRAQAADVLIINHALYFSTLDTGLLPSFERLILDEAHALEDISTDHFGLSVSQAGLAELVATVARPGGGEAIVSRLQALVELGEDAALAKLTGEDLERVRVAADEAAQALEHFSRACRELAKGAGEDGAGARVRLREEVLCSEQGEAFVEAGLELAKAVEELGEACRAAAGKVPQPAGQAELGEGHVLARELFAAGEEFAHAAQALEEVLAQASEDRVYWLSTTRNAFSLHGAPIYVGDELRRTVYDRMKTVVLTSATLTVRGDPAFFIERLGLEQVRERLAVHVFPSSFDFENQVVLCVATDVAEPSEEAWLEELAEGICRVVEAAGGRSLVLFTARQHLYRTYELCRRRLRSAGIPLMAQYQDGPRAELRAELAENVDSVLFATRSFFEGVDIPGPSLQCVILTKLPFAVPTDPVIEARCERLQEEGRNPMTEYYIPHAVLTFRQAFGRLIRSRQDRGAVVLFDPRVLKRGYGKAFLSAIPRCPRVFGDIEEIARAVRRHLEPGGQRAGGA